MSDAISSFLSSRLPITGLAAYSIHHADQLLEVECLSKSLYPSTTGEMLNLLVQSGRALLPTQERAVQYCWTYETQRLYVAGRPDGASLALLVENTPATQLVRVKDALQGFLELEEI